MTKKPVSAQNLSYHLGILSRENLIEKRIVAQIGNARINEILINPSQLQRIRYLLNIEIQNYTLVTGFGRIEKGYQLPDKCFYALEKLKFQITRILCFTSTDAHELRKSAMQTETLIPLDQCYDQYNYEKDYCNLDSKFYTEDLEQILRNELKNSNLILDLTPLSKLYSFKLLELANRYQLPCFYLGKSDQSNEVVIWMTGMKFEGKMNPMKYVMK
jgi:hypothetical protein